MASFFATCPKGLSLPLQNEIQKIGIKKNFAKDSGVQFESSWEKAYEVNRRSRVASRVVKPVLDYEASSLEQIRPGLKKHDFSKYLKPGGTFSLTVKLNQSKFNNQRYLMNEIRVGLLEDFESKGRGDISVNTEDPDLEIRVQVHRNTFSYALNMSGAPLSNRGYRQTDHIAPLRENLAAGLLQMTPWNKETPLVDFFCGSGTFLIEAATMDHLNKGPFAFERWANFKGQPALNRTENLSVEPLCGFDQNPASIQFTQGLVEKLGLNQVSLKQLALKDFSQKILPEKPGVVILNPPYGERLGTFDQAKKVYGLIGETLKAHFGGWEAWILSPHPDLTKELRLSAYKKHTVSNGGIPCMFLGYKIN